MMAYEILSFSASNDPTLVEVPLTHMPARRFGWHVDPADARDDFYPDMRDYYDEPNPIDTARPARIDLWSGCPIGVFDEGTLAASTVNAVAAAFAFETWKRTGAVFIPSRLFLSSNVQKNDRTTGHEAAPGLRAVLESCRTRGACSEEEWPYRSELSTREPDLACYTSALQRRIRSYARVPRSLDLMKMCLAAGHPFLFGFSVHESFVSDAVKETGLVPLPRAGETRLGGHVALATGYDDASECFLVRSSLGPAWGEQGHFRIAYRYLLDAGLADDFWMIRTVDASGA